MQLECTLENFDFIPLVKLSNSIWQPKKTLSKGSIFEVQDEIGHQLLAQYPKAFKVLGYGEAPSKRRAKQMTSDSLTNLSSETAEV